MAVFSMDCNLSYLPETSIVPAFLYSIMTIQPYHFLHEKGAFIKIAQKVTVHLATVVRNFVAEQSPNLVTLNS